MLLNEDLNAVYEGDVNVMFPNPNYSAETVRDDHGHVLGMRLLKYGKLGLICLCM